MEWEKGKWIDGDCVPEMFFLFLILFFFIFLRLVIQKARWLCCLFHDIFIASILLLFKELLFSEQTFH